ncbi:hypothetical protein BDW59DRAFT_153444 [Aspergillus cavernicola]|uniref:Condensation domain-containing protein n=1 Tax=Aspergillus cavernicola TaxID=176166 RepID=A0ABR4HNC7_9EURO
MAWSEVSERRWERPIDGVEGYFVYPGSASASLCDGREHYTIFSKVQIELSIPVADVESALKQAWLQLRYEQPLIAAKVEGMTRVYEVPDEAALQAWLTASFVVSTAADAEELYSSVAPITQATFYYIPRSSEVVLRAQHYVVDGVGLLLLWDRYLSALSAPAVEAITFGDEPTRLSAPLEDILGNPGQPTPEEAEQVLEIWGKYTNNVPGIGPESDVGRVPAGKCRHTSLVLPLQTTEAIVRACKEKNITVTSAVQAAYIQTIIKFADPNTPSSHYVSPSSFNLRRYLPHPYNTAQHAASVLYTPIPFYLDLPASFWEIVSALNQFYRGTFGDNPAALELVPHITRFLYALPQSPAYQASAIPHDALPSSLGTIEQYVQRTYGSTVTVCDLTPAMDVTLGMSSFFIYTFRDQLRVIYSFNDAYEDPADIDRYLEEMQKVLAEELLA